MDGCKIMRQVIGGKHPIVSRVEQPSKVVQDFAVIHCSGVTSLEATRYPNFWYLKCYSSTHSYFWDGGLYGSFRAWRYPTNHLQLDYLSIEIHGFGRSLILRNSYDMGQNSVA